jgi:nucleotide-binding universal stress UspA family protein
MKRIVVGLDGSEASVDATRWAAALAEAVGAEVVVVNAYVPVQSEIRPAYFERLRREQAELMATWCSDSLSSVPHRLQVSDGDPRDALPAAAAEHDADLLVVASTGSSGRTPGLLHLGSVVEYLAHHVERPLAVITTDASHTIARIVIGVDGSAHSRRAVRWAGELAAATGAAVTAVAVEEAGRPICAAEDDGAWLQGAEAVIRQDWAAPLNELGERFEVVAARELPVAETVLSLAADEGADLVVMGVRGVGGVTGVRIGGVALATLHRADRPVVLVPPADEQ